MLGISVLCLLGLARGLRVVAVGDLHGDYDTALEAYRIAGIVDKEGHWAGGSDLTVVQTGDVLDRGPDTIRLFRWIMQLQGEAAQAGGAVVQLLGNHEVMNLKEDYRYVSGEETDSFGGAGARAEAFAKHGWLGQYLRSRNITHQIGNTVFVHGGITGGWADLRVDGINAESSSYLRHDSPADLRKRKIFSAADSPLWFRGFAGDSDCEELSRALDALGASRMVMGHTINEDHKIHARCDGMALLIDVGLSSVYGRGHAAAVELTQTATTAIYPGKATALPHIPGIEGASWESSSDSSSESPSELSSVPLWEPTAIQY